MKALLREFAPTAIFAIIVIGMLSMTLRGLTEHIQQEGIQHAEVIGKLNLVNYRLDCVEKAVIPSLHATILLEETSDGS